MSEELALARTLALAKESSLGLPALLEGSDLLPLMEMEMPPGLVWGCSDLLVCRVVV